MSTEIHIHDKEKYAQLINKYAETNIDLNLCKRYLSKLIESPLTNEELKKDIQEFLESINNKK